MFQFQPSRRPRTSIGVAINMAELVYHSIVRSVRKSHNNAFIAIFMNVLQAVILVLAFYVMFTILGLRGAAIRGDFLLYIMSGIFLFLVHTKALAAVVSSEGPASPIMKHAPMTTAISIFAAAIGSLYLQLLSLFIVLFIYHVAFTPVVIEDPIAALGMLILSWFSGCAIGLVFLAATPWAPGFVGIMTQIYSRANMIASGTMPSMVLALFDWNPLFHVIDQVRGYVFINYNPRYSSWEYAFWVAVILLMIGLMGEFYTRRHASLSWSARG